GARHLLRGRPMRPPLLDRLRLGAVEVRVRRREVALLPLVHPGGNSTELDDQDADTQRPGLHGQRLAERLERVFARCVDAVERARPATEDTFTTVPPPRSHMPGRNAEISRSGPTTSVSSIASATDAGV